MAKKQKVILYGNCHMIIVSHMLRANPSFSEKYKLVGFRKRRPCFYAPKMRVTDAKKLKKHLSDTDVFIHQSISKSFRGELFSTDYLKQDSPARCIWMFNYFFRGYIPGMQHLSKLSDLKLENSDNTLLSLPPRFSDVMLFWLYANNRNIEESFEWLNSGEDTIASKFVHKVAKDDIAELKRRQTEQVNLGNEIIGMSDVMDTWKENHLGIVSNHPTMHYYWILCHRILDGLGIDDYEETWDWPESLFHTNSDYPVFSYVRKTLPDIDWPSGIYTLNRPQMRTWNLEFVRDEFKKIEENYEEHLGGYRQHKINKFFPL